MEKKVLLERIDAHLNKFITETVHYASISGDTPSKGEIVISFMYAGKPYIFDNQFARVVQIRLGCGQFGSDMYFLRLPTGELITAENQSFRKIPDQFISDVEKHFSTTLEDEKEGFEDGFTIAGKYPETGFIIDGKNTKGTPDEPVAITVISAS
jgi:hypothetical protein